jgi:hypothetical protein
VFEERRIRLCRGERERARDQAAQPDSTWENILVLTIQADTLGLSTSGDALLAILTRRASPGVSPRGRAIAFAFPLERCPARAADV